MKKIVLIGIGLLLLSCQNNSNPVTNQYLNYEGKDDKLSGGVKMIPITTSRGHLMSGQRELEIILLKKFFYYMEAQGLP